MARLGDTIDPSAFTRDYTGMANAGIMGAQGFSQLADKVGGAFRDYNKEQKDAKNEVRSTGALIKAASTLFPEQKGLYDSLLNDLNNEDVPISERASLGPVMKELLSWNIAERTNEREFGLKREQLNMQRADQNLRREAQAVDLAGANLQNQAKGFEIASAIQNQEMDQATKAGLGPGLLEETLKLTPEGMKADILKNIGDYDAAEQFDLASKIRGLLPKATQAKAPTLAEVAVPGGKQQVQWDAVSGTFVPIQVGGLNPTGGVGAVGSGIEPPPDVALLGGVIDQGGVGVDGQPGVLPNLPGFIPTPPRDELKALQVDKLKQEMDSSGKSKNAAVEASKTMLSQVEQLEKHPGFNGLFGVGIGDSMILGTDAKDASVLFDQLKAKGFLEAVKGMQGMGALSDTEGKKLDVAYLGLQTSMSEKAAKARIQEIKEVLKKGLSNVSAVQQQQVDPYAEGAKILQGFPR